MTPKSDARWRHREPKRHGRRPEGVLFGVAHGQFFFHPLGRSETYLFDFSKQFLQGGGYVKNHLTYFFPRFRALFTRDWRAKTVGIST